MRIGCGTLSEVSDYDDDDLKDYLEILYHASDWQSDDYDQDGCKDGVEYYGGRDPLVIDPEGDLNRDCKFGIEEVIFVLQKLSELR